MFPILPQDYARYSAAARLIEDDLNEAYYTCRERFGADVAGALLVFALRQKMNKHPNQWPPPDYLGADVAEFLIQKGLLKD